MTARPAKELGRLAAARLHEQMAAAGLLDGLLPRILDAMPASVRDARSDDAGFFTIFGTLADHARCFGSACLAHAASERYTRRMFGLRVVTDEANWQQFTEGVLDYATETMKHPATRAEIIQDITDQDNAVTRYCASYPPEASSVLIDAAIQIRRVAREVLRGLDEEG